MAKRLLVYSPLAIWQAPIYETQLEIVQNYINDGYVVSLLTCAAHLPTCEANPDHIASICALCRSRSQSGINWLGRDNVDVSDYLCVTPMQRATVERLAMTHPASVSALRELELDGSDVGMAALASLVSLLREPRPDMGKYRSMVEANLRSAGLVHYSIRNHIERLRPDVLLLFNGRVATLRPALRAGQAMGVKTLVYEVAGAPDRYLVTVNTYPHDLEALKTMCNETFDNAPESVDQKAAVADAWFDARIANRPDDGLAFAESQEVGRLPEQLASTGLKVGIFISSEDEFVAIEGWEPPFYRDQAEGLRLILRAFANRDDVQFILRVHPHLRGVENSQTRELREIAAEFPTLRLIAADSAVHTYSLIKVVDIVVTFGSTVAMEAVYLGKPSLLLGRHVFEEMGGVTRPRSHEEVVRMLSDAAITGGEKLSDHAREAVVRFGFAQSRLGIPYRYVRRTGFETAILSRDGHESQLAPSLLVRILTSPDRAIRRIGRQLRKLFFALSNPSGSSNPRSL